MLVKKLHETAGSIYHCCLMVFVLLIFLYSKIVLDNGNPVIHWYFMNSVQTN